MQEDNKDIDIKNKVLEKINCDKICPTPKWCFACKNYFLWTLLGALVVLISMIFSILVFLFVSHDWDVYSYVNRNLLEHILVYTPYFWILLFLMFVLFASYIFTKTKEGYKFESRKATLLTALTVLLMMLVFLFLGIGQLIHETMFERLPQYDYILHDKNNIWSHPEKGLLSGQVTKVLGPRDFYLEDFKRNMWQVKERENVRIKRNFIIKQGDKLKIIGVQMPGNIFMANTIKPWDMGLGF